MAESLADLDATELLDLFRHGAASPVEAVDACLDRIERDEERINAFVTITADRARSQAQESERRWIQGRPRPLEGVPVALKDLVATAGVATGAGSRVYRDWVPERDATVATKLREAGTISLGKTAMTEFAAAITGNANLPEVHNPWDRDHTPGGSSSGAGAALAARQTPLAVGSDTGGSIRIPAAYCGVTGLKPTYGRVSRAGVLPLSWTLDHVGPMARSVADVAGMLAVMGGPDRSDPGSARYQPPASRERPADLAGLRIGIPSGPPFDHCDPEVAACAGRVADCLEDRGAQALPIELPDARHAPVIGFTILCAEAASLHESLSARKSELTPQVVATIEHGQSVSAVDYLRCQRLRRLVQEDFGKAFESVDAVLVPSNPVPAPRLDEHLVEVDGVTESALFTAVRMTSISNVTGLPSLAFPSGMSGGMPVGVQVIGRGFDEATLLSIGEAWQRESDFHRRVPGYAGDREAR